MPIKKGQIKKVAATVLLAPFAAAGLGWLFQRAGVKRDTRRYPPLGLLLSQRGRYLHVLREGIGRPAVIFEAGLAASSLSWARVRPSVAGFSGTFSYDRAGLGWSHPLRSRPTLEQMLDDLHGVVMWLEAESRWCLSDIRLARCWRLRIHSDFRSLWPGQ